MGIPSLVLGDFDLTDWSGATNTGVSVIAQGTDKGSPVPIEVAVKSWLQDGSVVVTQGYDNRTVTLRARLRSADLTALADAEASLFAELGKPNTLTWTPGDGTSPASVFVVVTSSMDYSPSTDEDLVEGMAFPWRTYNLRLVCEAFVRSVDEVVAPALAASGTTTTLVDACSSTTGWTGAVNGSSTSPSVVSGAVSLTSSALEGNVELTLTRTGSISTSSTKYLQIDWKSATSGTSPLLNATGNGTPLSRIAQGPSPTAGLTRTTFQVAASSVTTLQLIMTSGSTAKVATTRNFQVDNINRTDIRPSIGTTRQQLRSIEIVGSARTKGRLSLEHASSALGDVIVYAFDDSGVSYSPPLRQYRTSGGGTVTANSALVSGSSEPVTTSLFFTASIPNTTLPPGNYALVARMLAGTAGVASVTHSRTLQIGGGLMLTETLATTVAPTLATTYQNIVLDTFQLPMSWPPTTGSTRLSIKGTGASGSTITLDEVWLFNLDIGQLTMLQCGTDPPSATGSFNRVWIDSPTTDDPKPNIAVGFASDRSDSQFPADLTAWQTPEFNPPALSLFTVTSNALEASAALAYTPAWHTNAAQ